MQAVHIGARGLQTPTDATFLDAVLRMIAGVVDVVVVRSLGLVSVLYDERKVTARTILREIRATGFDARLMRPGALTRSASGQGRRHLG
jgi:copper chaperone CopZ